MAVSDRESTALPQWTCVAMEAHVMSTRCKDSPAPVPQVRRAGIVYVQPQVILLSWCHLPEFYSQDLHAQINTSNPYAHAHACARMHARARTHTHTHTHTHTITHTPNFEASDCTRWRWQMCLTSWQSDSLNMCYSHVLKKNQLCFSSKFYSHVLVRMWVICKVGFTLRTLE